MYWTLELASKLEDAPWPATKEELIDYAVRSGAPLEVLENLQEIEDEGEIYESIEDIWPDYPSKDDFFFNEEEYQRTRPATEQRAIHQGSLFLLFNGFCDCFRTARPTFNRIVADLHRGGAAARAAPGARTGTTKSPSLRHKTPAPRPAPVSGRQNSVPCYFRATKNEKSWQQSKLNCAHRKSRAGRERSSIG